jgi:hypothetical protein
MALTFPVLVRHENGQCVAETPALPGWSAAAPDVAKVLDKARQALEAALLKHLEPIGYDISPARGVFLHELTIDEPSSWWWKDPSE